MSQLEATVLSPALEKYTNPDRYPDLRVPQHAIARAVRALPEVEALALIRAAYADDGGGWASLEDARTIYASIVRRQR